MIQLRRLPVTSLFLFLIFWGGVPSFAQVLDTHKEVAFSEADIHELQNATSLFVLREQDMPKIGEFSDALKKVWDFNELRFISHKDLVDYFGEDGYAYFYIAISNKEVRTKEKRAYELTQLYLSLVLPKTVYEDGNPRDESRYFCRIELFPEYNTMLEASQAAKYDHFDHRLYQKSKIKNWNPGMIQAYLKELQINLNASMRPSLYAGAKNEEALSRLRQDTLFVPKYVLRKFDKLTGNENRKHRYKDLFQKYPSRYKLISAKELSAKITNATKEVFFLDYVKSATDKFVSVYSTQDGLVYKKFKPMSYNIKDDDINAIF